MLQAIDVPRHDELQELAGPLVGRLLVDVDRVDVGGEDVADGADDHVAFLVDVHGGGHFLDPPHDDLPQAEEIGQVAGELALGAVGPGRADDEPYALGRVELEHDVAEAAADVLVLDLPRDADAAQGGHEHQVAARDADVGREASVPWCRSLP